MNVDQKLTAIRDLIQQDVGHRGLARDPLDNLLTATRNDFANACASIADHSSPSVAVVTGFIIPTVDPARPETDGPLGSIFLCRACRSLGIQIAILAEGDVRPSLWSALARLDLEREVFMVTLEPNWKRYPYSTPAPSAERGQILHGTIRVNVPNYTHLIAIERVGPNHTLDSLRRQPATTDRDVAAFAAAVPEPRRGRYFTMKGRDITDLMHPAHHVFERDEDQDTVVTVGIGDGGNEIGMGKLPWDTIRRNIPNGELVACRVPTDHLIVAGVSNWGAYAIAAGVALLRGVELPAELFDPNREREILRVMVEKGPLIDGVTGKQTATVDGLSWDDYIRPLVEIGKIVRG